MIHLDYRSSMINHVYQFTIHKYEILRINKSPHDRKESISIVLLYEYARYMVGYGRVNCYHMRITVKNRNVVNQGRS